MSCGDKYYIVLGFFKPFLNYYELIVRYEKELGKGS